MAKVKFGEWLIMVDQSEYKIASPSLNFQLAITTHQQLLKYLAAPKDEVGPTLVLFV